MLGIRCGFQTSEKKVKTMALKPFWTLFLLCNVMVISTVLLEGRPIQVPLEKFNLKYKLSGISTRMKLRGNVPKRIINLGLPKTGTSSFSKKLKEILGDSKVTHWTGCRPREDVHLDSPDGWCTSEHFCSHIIMEAVRQNQDRILDFYDKNQIAFAQIDCMTMKLFDFPQILFLETLLKQYEGREVIWVHTTRSSEKWIKSVSRWTDMKERFLHHIKNNPSLKALGWSPVLKKGDDYLLMKFKEWHEERVISVAKKYKRKVFIVDLEDLNGAISNFNFIVQDLTGKEITSQNYAWENKGRSLLHKLMSHLI